MGLGPSKDVDFCVEADSYDAMKTYLVGLGLRIWQERPEFVTIRGQLPLRVVGKFGGILANHNGLVVDADFTLCRAETQYSDGRHPDTVTPCDILTDLNRRDFTVNAIAVTENGYFHDPHQGVKACRLGLLSCVGEPMDRFTEDPLRMLRAIRFAVTKKLRITSYVDKALRNPELLNRLRTLPIERVHHELLRAFQTSSWESMRLLIDEYPFLGLTVLAGGKLWLKPTLEQR
jgi:tRNA nucleotidyltransferase/poly(A) polymerase